MPALRRLERRLERVEATVTSYTPRRDLTKATKRRHCEVIAWLGGRCPCCGLVNVVDDDGAVLDAEFEHFYSRERRAFAETWLVCRPGHGNLTVDGRADRISDLQAYQRKGALLGGMAQLPLLPEG